MAEGVILCTLALSVFFQVALCATATCTASVATKGEQATITCHFKGNVSHEKDSISVHKLGDDSSILDCFWESSNQTLACIHSSEYLVDRKDWKNLTLIIPSVAEKHVGQYVCQTMLSDEGDHVSCKLKLKDAAVPICRIGTEKDLHCQSCSNTVAIVFVVLFSVESVCIIAVVLYSRREWVLEKLASCPNVCKCDGYKRPSGEEKDQTAPDDNGRADGNDGDDNHGS